MLRPAAGRVAVVALAAGAVACGRGDAPAAVQPNVLLITIDTLRADRLGSGVAPALDRLAASGLRFSAARSAVPLTLPSHATIHTGLLPPQHGVRDNGSGSLDPSHRTIAHGVGGTSRLVLPVTRG